jgi:two-component system, OmpR family, sensor kinase
MRLRRPRRPTLRTRVLAGVLAVTLLALVAFDVAAVTALRGYLLGRTDQQLRGVLGLYRVQTLACQHLSLFSCAPGAVTTVPARPVPKSTPPQQRRLTQKPVPRKVVVGPVLSLGPVFGQYYVGTAFANGPRVLVRGGPDLVPQLPADLRTLARNHQGQTVASSNGQDQLRLLAEPFPGYGIVYAATTLSNVNKTIGQLELILLIGSVAAGLLAAGGVTWVMRRGLRPIEAMAGQADKITAGDLTDRVSPADTRTEVGRLGAALNGMLTRIEDFIAEREAGQEATRRFFADASHELRTPLASLRANAELYQQGALTRRSQVDEAMRRITLESQRMSGLVDDMLRLARLDQHPARHHDLVDLTALVQASAERAQLADPARAWRCRVAPGLAVTGDEELLRRAVDNLLANVHAHTPAGTAATITAACRDDMVVVEVSDDGPGVPADQLPRIFDRFYRAAAPSRRSGAGLGLAIVTTVADAHHGTAGAALNDPSGLRVTLTLPAAPVLAVGSG